MTMPPPGAAGELRDALATLDKYAPAPWVADCLQMREAGEYWAARRVAHFGGQGRNGEEASALCAAVVALRNNAEALLAADALRVVHHRDPGTPSAAALAYAETFLRENGYYDDGTPTRTFALALDDFARAALGGAS